MCNRTTEKVIRYLEKYNKLRFQFNLFFFIKFSNKFQTLIATRIFVKMICLTEKLETFRKIRVRMKTMKTTCPIVVRRKASTDAIVLLLQRFSCMSSNELLKSLIIPTCTIAKSWRRK